MRILLRRLRTILRARIASPHEASHDLVAVIDQDHEVLGELLKLLESDKTLV